MGEQKVSRQTFSKKVLFKLRVVDNNLTKREEICRCVKVNSFKEQKEVQIEQAIGCDHEGNWQEVRLER